tara:strand:- start:44621 stop:45262 length:642 start_codon:yes stop_codon:yes gene_type:complete
MQGFEKLQNSLLAAKQVMNKVETKTYQTGNVDSSLLTQDTSNLQSSPQQADTQQPTSDRAQRDVKSNMSEDKIKGSKLPENIKKLMLENPIPTVNYENELSNDFIDEVAKKMKKQESFGAGAHQTPQQIPQQVIESTPNNNIPTTPTNNNSSIQFNDDLKNFIKEAIVETLDGIVESKLNKLMETNKEVSENLQIRVGDSMFIGKITDVRKAK